MVRVKRFASKGMRMIQQLKTDVVMDFPDNLLVSRIVEHKWHDGEVYMKCRWVGFTKEMDSWQRAKLLAKTCPECVSAYITLTRKKIAKANKIPDTHLSRFAEKHFPSLQEKEEERVQRETPWSYSGRQEAH